jgi:hypothetical protein
MRATRLDTTKPFAEWDANALPQLLWDVWNVAFREVGQDALDAGPRSALELPLAVMRRFNFNFSHTLPRKRA